MLGSRQLRSGIRTPSTLGDGTDDDSGETGWRRFENDRRAIEGLPIRLVIALVVGVASLSVMMGMLSGIEGLAVTELDAQPESEIVPAEEQTVAVTVIDPDGAPVADATVIIRGGTARHDGVAYADTGEDGTAKVEISPQLRSNQDQGTLTIDIKPPAGSEYADERSNTELLVVADS
ncbi:MAG: carboxypeptidase regulatory-like domain-containing protein [Haloferacaceae archaeon]